MRRGVFRATPRRVALLAALAGAALALVFLPSALAVHDAACPLNGSGATTNFGCLFELDGNVADAPAASGNNGGIDWANVFGPTGNSLLAPNDPVAGGLGKYLNGDFQSDSAAPDPTYFSTSAADIDQVNTWKCGPVNNPTNKDDLLNSYATLLEPQSGADAGHVIFYAASERDTNNGDSFAGFWLFKSAVGCNPGGPGTSTAFTGAHSLGDLLVLSNFTGGGGNAAVTVYKWNPGTPEATNPLELLGQGGLCSVAQPNDGTCGTVNTSAITTPWPPSQTAGNALPTNTFLEVGVDLTNLLDLANDTIPCFARFQAETRSSQQTTAQLKDYTAGRFNSCSSTTVTHPTDTSNADATLDDSTAVSSTHVIKDSATVTGTALVGNAPNPVGTVAFTYCKPTVQTAGGSTACAAGTTVTAGTRTLNGSANPATVLSDGVSGLAAGRWCFTATYTDTSTPPNYPDGSSDSSTTECFRIGDPHLTITKTADFTSPVNAGDPIGFTVSLASDGNSTAHGVTLNDPLPGGTPGPIHWTLNSHSGDTPACTLTGADGSQVLACSSRDLPVGSTITLDVRATTSETACGQYDNTATFNSTDASTGTANASETCRLPNLSVTKTADATSVSAGGTIGFTITVSNSNAAGTGTATGVTLADALPAGTGVDWSIADQSGGASCVINGSPATENLACGPIDLAPGASFSVHVTSSTTEESCKAYPNHATADATNAPAVSADATTTVQCPNLSITKTADAVSVSAGSPIGFTITVTNSNAAGTGTAKGVTLADALPGGAGVDWGIAGQSGGAGCVINGSPTTENLACGPIDLAPGASFSVHVTSSTTEESCKAYPNTATADATNAPPITANDTETVLCPNLSITKTADAVSVSAGSPIGFTITVSNSNAAGTGTAKGVTLADALPAGTGVDWGIAGQSGGAGCVINGSPATENLACGPIDLAPGASFSVHVTSGTTKESCKAYPNTATADATNAPQVQASASETVLCPDLTATKTADAASVNAGDPIGFTVTVSNSNAAGTGTATGVTVNDPLPAGSGAGVTWSIDTQSNAGLCSVNASAPQTLSCGPTTLAPGASFSVHITATTAAAECSVYDNTAHVTSTNDGGGDPEAVITCSSGQVKITKTADATSVNAGDAIGFNVLVENTGTGLLKGVTVNDPLPAGSGAGVTWQIDNQTSGGTCSISGSAPQVLSCGPQDLAAGGSFFVHITATTSADECSTYNNTAEVTTTNDGNDQDSASITCNPASIHIHKVADAASVNAGDPIGFTITVNNSGTGLATGVTVGDALPAGSGAGVTWSIDNQTSGGTCSISGSAPQVLSCGPQSLAAGGSFFVHITATTSAAECSVYDNTAHVTTTNDGSDQSEDVITCHPASIHIHKVADAGSVNAGDVIGFTVTVNNSGTGTAKGVTVSDNLPAGSGTGVTWSVDNQTTGGTCSISGSAPQVLSCGPQDLAAGGSFFVHITATTSASECSVYDNTAHVTTTNDGSDQSEDVITCNPATIHIHKTADAASVNAGDPIGFTVTVNNSGTGTAKGVTVSDNLPAGSGTGVTWQIDTQSDPGLCSIAGSAPQVLSCGPTDLATGGSFSVHITATTSATECSTYNNTAHVTTTNDGSDQSSASITCNPASIHILKTADAASVSAGDAIGFTVTVNNSGTGLAKGVTVSDNLPAGSGTGVTWQIDTQSDPGLCSIAGSAPQVLSCGPTDLAAGGSFSVHITATTSATECSTYNNTADVSTSNDGSDEDSASITCNPAHIHITKTADAASVNAGSNIGFTITASNSGPGTAHGVQITDTLPTNAGLSWIESPDKAECSIALGVLTCNIGDLASGGSFSVHIQSPTTTQTCGVVNNTGNVTTTNDGSDSASASVTVNCVVASIQPTQTTCQQFLAGSVAPLTQMQYGVKGNGSNAAINNVSPGVFFYYVIVHVSSSGSQTVTVNQSIVGTNTFTRLVAIQSVKVFTAPSCINVSTTSTSTSEPARATFNATPGDYVVQVKYSPSSLAGAKPVPSPSTVNYQYVASLNGSTVPGSTQGIALVKK